jgi:hypothetical protein
VPPEIRDISARQGKSPAAENAVKLTVYKADGEGASPEQPEDKEPVVRETKRKAAETAEDVSEIVKKWSKK